MNREEKAAKVAELAENIKSSNAMLVVNYRGLTVSEASEVRDGLREVGGRFEVVKNSMVMRAADDAGAEGLKELIDGPTAITFCSEDAVESAKVLVKFAREFKPLEVRGGILEGENVDADKIKFLASLPPYEVLVAQLLGGLQGPIRGLVTVMAGPVRGLVNVLGRIQEQKEAEAA